MSFAPSAYGYYLLGVLQVVFLADEAVDPVLAPVRSLSGTEALPLDGLPGGSGSEQPRSCAGAALSLPPAFG